LQIPHEEQSMMYPPPESQGVEKQGAAQLQTVPHAQEAAQ
jgi:hypothetical protein